MKNISKLSALSLLVVGCATGGGLSPRVDASRSRTLVFDRPTTRSLEVGPSTIHASAINDGALLFTAVAVTGTDQDCVGSLDPAALEQTRLKGNRVVTFDVPAGRIACVETTSGHLNEVSWHRVTPHSAKGSLLATSSN